MEIEQKETRASPHILSDLSYDLILGRDWCEANGIVLDFSKKKLYFLEPSAISPDPESVYQFDDKPSDLSNNPTSYAQLEQETVLQPFHETKVVVRSTQNDNQTLYVKSHDPLIDQFGIFVVKGLVEFKQNVATIVLSNLTNKSIVLPQSTIVASLDFFDESDWTTHDPKWFGDISEDSDNSDTEGEKLDNDVTEITAPNSKNNTKTELAAETTPKTIEEPCFKVFENEVNNQYVHWKPIVRRKQDIIVNKDSKVVRFVDSTLALDEIETTEDNHKTKAAETPTKSDDSITNEDDVNAPSSTNLNEPLNKEPTAKAPHETVKIDEAYLTSEQLQLVRNLLENKSKVFASKDEAPGKDLNVDHKIDTGDSPPVHQPKYRTSHQNRPMMDSLIQDMLKKKIIEPSRSPWSSPIVLVPKKDGTVFFCVDYRKLNAVTKKDSYALPRIDELLALLNVNHYFSSLDCNAGYFQIPMEQSSKEKSAFITDQGLFQFNVMSFGLTNAPATFQRYMDAVLAGLKWNILLIYIDDILVFSPTFEDHVRDVNDVFDRLLEANITLKPSKCNLFQHELLYLGHLVSA